MSAVPTGNRRETPAPRLLMQALAQSYVKRRASDHASCCLNDCQLGSSTMAASSSSVMSAALRNSSVSLVCSTLESLGCRCGAAAWFRAAFGGVSGPCGASAWKDDLPLSVPFAAVRHRSLQESRRCGCRWLVPRQLPMTVVHHHASPERLLD